MVQCRVNSYSNPLILGDERLQTSPEPPIIKKITITLVK